MSAAAVREFDLIVVGAGPVGENVADYAAKRGLSVAIVEAELVGGECSYWACMPSKALLRSGAAVAAARSVAGAREAVTGDVDAAAVFARRDSFTADWDDHGQAEWLESAGIALIRGHARLVAEREIEVDGERYIARAAIAIATGSVPVLPDTAGLAEAGAWSTREATSAKAVPARFAVIGGGVAAVELATAFASLGSRVTVLARSTLLAGFEPFAGDAVTQALRDLGADVRLGVTPHDVQRLDDGSLRIALDGGDIVEADELLVATGRTPRTSDLGLDAIGLDPADGLAVDDTMLVHGTTWLYAVGDVNGRAMVTHQGKYQARAAGEAIAARFLGTPLHDEPWGAHVATADHSAVPQVVFTDPEVVAIGPTEHVARSRGINLRVVEYDLGHVAGAALYADGYRGRAKAIVDTDRDVLIGVTLVGPAVAELLHAATTAIVGEVPVSRLWHAVPAYPTISEIWLRLLEELGRAD